MQGELHVIRLCSENIKKSFRLCLNVCQIVSLYSCNLVRLFYSFLFLHVMYTCIIQQPSGLLLLGCYSPLFLHLKGSGWAFSSTVRKMFLLVVVLPQGENKNTVLLLLLFFNLLLTILIKKMSYNITFILAHCCCGCYPIFEAIFRF